MTPRLLAQLAYVFDRDAARLAGEYEWPPKKLTAEEVAEADRLRGIADEVFERARAAGLECSGTDAVFG